MKWILFLGIVLVCIIGYSLYVGYFSAESIAQRKVDVATSKLKKAPMANKGPVQEVIATKPTFWGSSNNLAYYGLGWLIYGQSDKTIPKKHKSNIASGDSTSTNLV